MLSLLIIAHLCGDFLLQNDWMQTKSRSSAVCSVHVACYSIPFIGLVIFANLPVWALATILAQHWAQDRFGLHLRWMKIYRQTPPDQWPLGPLCNDQAMHMTFIALVTLFLC